ncbi:MAG: SAM-dependent methyltransferase, partial [Lachnospiraceae bacterium]|jgi:tRNA1Val (adenine37-N6)-methyltransferase|nr:SAM-dependent methyltransferase [Lachnospiraceae bacterium]
MVHPFIDREPNMVLIEANRGGRARLTVEKPLIVFAKKGVYSAELEDLYSF